MLAWLLSERGDFLLMMLRVKPCALPLHMSLGTAIEEDDELPYGPVPSLLGCVQR